MTLPVVLLIGAMFCMAWNVMTSMRVVHALEKRGEKINYVLLRLMAPVYAHRLAKMKAAETGGSGSLYYQWILSVNLALVLVVIALVIRFV